ncbi:MAG TPA: helix-hairpin-helix domain-containing protein [Desulfobacterales bacterium]|nr:helix-hairpin-helix domain-containing protein [Desulfobacterales bacterium]HIP39521.1 helix-hairpin-helix domain-containing protein [Desulfocapsa sulfexigens]
MNSVTQVKINPVNSQQKRTGNGVALFFCVLFFSFQVFNTFSPSSSSVKHSKYLTLFSKDTLGLADSITSLNITKTSNLLFSGNSRFSPFFFKPIAINYCDINMLMSVKGIGPDLAGNIITTRTRIGKFTEPEDLLLVKGIGNNRLHKFKPYFSFQ